jgi:hypothetical protein
MLEGRLLNREHLLQGLEASYTAIRQIIVGTNLSKADQNAILAQLAHCPVVVQQTAALQAKELKKSKEDENNE